MSPVMNQPSAVIGRSSGRLVVAEHHVRALDQHLAVVGDLHLHVRNRFADAAVANRTEPVRRDDRRSFGQPVALGDRNADARERQRDVAMQRRAAARKRTNAVESQRRLDLSLAPAVARARICAARAPARCGPRALPPHIRVPMPSAQGTSLALSPPSALARAYSAARRRSKMRGTSAMVVGSHRLEIVDEMVRPRDVKAPVELNHAEHVDVLVDVRERQNRKHRIAGLHVRRSRR